MTACYNYIDVVVALPAFSDHNHLSSINEHTQSKVVNYTPPAKVIWMFIKWPFSIVLDVCQVQLLINDYDL